MADDSYDLAQSISELSQLLLDEETLDDTLQRVAELACRTIGGCDMAGVTLLRDGEPITAAFTDPTAPEIDVAQYETGSGPCLDACRDRSIYRIDATTEDERWRPFADACVAQGIMSTLSIPLGVWSRGLGALNLYSRARAGFTEDDEEVGTLFGRQASVALANALAYLAAERLNEQLREALVTRDVIGQAKGILMASNGVTADQAFDMLKRASQRGDAKLRDIARHVVDRRHERPPGTPRRPGR